MSKLNIEQLGKLTRIKTGKLDANAASQNGIYPFFTCSREPLKISSYSYDCECVLVAGNGDLNVKYYNGKFDAYQRTYIIECHDKEKLYMRYLYYYLYKYVETLRQQSIGGVIKYIKLENLTKANIPIPLYENQKQIAKTLDTAAELLALRIQQLAELDNLIKSIFYDMFGDPMNNEKVWVLHELKDFLISIDSGRSPICYEQPSEKDYWGVLKLSAVTGGKFLPEENKAIISDDDVVQKHEVVEGDLLFTRKNTRELVGACAYVFGTRNKLLLPDTIFRFVTKPTINKIYLWALFNEVNYKFNIQMLATGSSGSMPNISKSKLYDVIIPVPPLNLQTQFAEIVIKIEEQKALVQKAIDETQYLFDSLMSEYFDD